MLDDPSRLNRIEELKTKLTSKTFQGGRKRRDNFYHPFKKTVLDSWKKKTEEEENISEKIFSKTSIFKKFFVFSVSFFAIAIGYASYTFFWKGNLISNENIEISVIGNTYVAGGEELPLQIQITNSNSSPLELADLLIEYPKSSSLDFSKDVERMRISLGTIPSGGIRNENVKLVLFGEQGSLKPLKISLEYRVEDSNAIFVKEKLYEVTINSTPINLTIEAPNVISSNQDITLNIKAKLNSTKPAGKMLVKIDYPFGFEFKEGSPLPTISNNIWNLGDLSPGVERTITVSGKMIDAYDGEDKIFRVWSGSEKSSDKSEIGVVFNTATHTVSITKPFLEAKLYVNGVYSKEYAVNTKTKIVGEIRWANNLETQVNDMEIKAKISGNAVNRKEIVVERGFYNSSEDTIIWNKNYDDVFAEIDPGDSDSVKFTLASLPLVTGSDSNGILSEPYIKIDVSVSGRQPEEGYAVGELENSESKMIKIISDVGFASKVLHFSGPFKNTGYIPPKVEHKTSYTIVWTVSNSANSISKARVRSSLPPWVNFIGSASPPSEDLTFNTSTKEIIWNLGNIKRGTGISSEEREVSFQVEFTPSLSQVGQTSTLINDSVLTGVDDFANVNVQVNKSSLDTKLGSDPLAPLGADRVVE
ncbi:MAG: hypothetical protein WCX79_02015 [Candidatus Paceibacterota bacterium]|jgi:hypothetical protein